MRIAQVVVSSIALVVLTACSSDDPEVPQVSPSEAEASVVNTPSETPAQEPTGPSDEDLRQFIDLVNTNRPDDVKKALAFTAPDSAARAVVTVWQARYTATEQAGYDLGEPSTVTGGEGSFEVCSKEPPCQTWGVFKAQGDLIADFAIDGKPMQDRVILGSKKKIKIGDLGTARLIGSYKFVSNGGVSVFLEVNASADVTFGWDSDAYVAPDGAQVGTSAVEGPGTLRSGARAIVAYYFPKAQLGGDLFITAVEDGGAQRDENVTIQTG